MHSWGLYAVFLYTLIIRPTRLMSLTAFRWSGSWSAVQTNWGSSESVRELVFSRNIVNLEIWKN